MYVSRETLKLNLIAGLKYFNIEFNNNQIELLFQYFDELIYWSKIKNITAIRDENEIILKHFLDSVSSFIVIKYANENVIDLGTGAGLPGIPLKILFPNIKITFVDSGKRKIEILEKICKNLGITKFDIINDNIENLGKKTEYREKYDVVVIRALSEFRVILEYGIPFLKINGKLVLYKGPNVNKEVENSEKALSILQAKILENVYISLPFSDIKRRIIVVEKIGITSEKYPRKVGIPKKRPL